MEGAKAAAKVSEQIYLSIAAMLDDKTQKQSPKQYWEQLAFSLVVVSVIFKTFSVTSMTIMLYEDTATNSTHPKYYIFKAACYNSTVFFQENKSSKKLLSYCN